MILIPSILSVIKCAFSNLGENMGSVAEKLEAVNDAYNFLNDIITEEDENKDNTGNAAESNPDDKPKKAPYSELKDLSAYLFDSCFHNCMGVKNPNLNSEEQEELMCTYNPEKPIVSVASNLLKFFKKVVKVRRKGRKYEFKEFAEEFAQEKFSGINAEELKEGLEFLKSLKEAKEEEEREKAREKHKKRKRVFRKGHDKYTLYSEKEEKRKRKKEEKIKRKKEEDERKADKKKRRNRRKNNKTE
ncbi:hypothetical protein EHP00_1280 [Ecytonucleospora hepatopenaei]|uniref:Uncharacterized protein n=1 Tax=Ecytonucleospora hepatopenaei TaxID=646526 RepID=A0A1W0E6D7_9MICR|nr:hypothetical protein EHP00_1280 [Ecytonucleospora hepatopenaei]